MRNIGGVSQNPTTLLCIWVKSSPSSHVHWFTLSFLRHLSSSCLSKSFSLLHSRCHWLPLAVTKKRLARKNATKVQKSTRRRNRVLTQIHLICSVIRAASNEHSNEIPSPARPGPKRSIGKYLCPLHMDSYPAPIPRNSAPIAHRFRRLSPKLAPG